MSEHRMEMLFENVLCDASKSYQFVTTYGEDFEISSACDEFYDSFLEAQKDVLILPLTEELRAAVDFIAKDIKESLHSDTNPMGPYNTFNIFMRLFGDTVWHDD
jgi:hypothetical protein